MLLRQDNPVSAPPPAGRALSMKDVMGWEIRDQTWRQSARRSLGGRGGADSYSRVLTALCRVSESIPDLRLRCSAEGNEVWR